MPNVNWSALDLAELERLRDALDAIPCARLTYDEWVAVGMACKEAGLDVGDWDAWSATDADRYEPNACADKWETFTDEGHGGGLLVSMARGYGWDGATPTASARAARPGRATTRATPDPAPVLDLAQLDYAEDLGTYPADAAEFTRGEMLREYVRYVFEPGEWVCYGATTADVRQLRYEDMLERSDELLANGAQFVCVNPTDGQGRKNANVTAYRHTLVESDTLPKDEQLDLIRRLRLPCSAITDSGAKSVHAVVRIDAGNAAEYKQRVARLHAILNANGLETDGACKNPARLTRLPGGLRPEGMQRLIDVATSPYRDYAEWLEWVENRAPRKDVPPTTPDPDEDSPEQPEDADECGDDGAPSGSKERKAPTQAQLVEFMRRDDRLRGKFGTNVLDGGLYVCGPLPWDEGGERRRWTDADAELLFCYAQARTGTNSRRNVAGAFTITAAANEFNPIADMLDELPPWDGKPRADELLAVVFRCRNNEYTRAVSHAFMRGAVLRAYEPGCKFDSVLTLIGPQGCGKTYGTRLLAMRDAFLCETVTDLTDHKRTAEQTAGKWLCELGELEGMTGRRLTGVKQAITMQTVTVRLPYTKHAVDLPRSCCFVATTNEANFLTDPTGNRRFWPIRCADTSLSNRWHDASDRQLRARIARAWAEVRDEYKQARAKAADADEFRKLYPTTLPPDIERMADRMRDAASVEDTRVGVVREWLESTALREGITRVCARMVAERALCIDMGHQRGHQLTNEVSAILDACPGWQAVGKQRVQGYGTCRAWEHKGDGEQ
jgi:hypothetical protein